MTFLNVFVSQIYRTEGRRKKNGQRTEKGERIDRKDRWRVEEERKGKLLETFR